MDSSFLNVYSLINYLTQRLCLHPIALQFLHPLFTVPDVLLQLSTLHPPTQLILLRMSQLEVRGGSVAGGGGMWEVEAALSHHSGSKGTDVMLVYILHCSITWILQCALFVCVQKGLKVNGSHLPL